MISLPAPEAVLSHLDPVWRRHAHRHRPLPPDQPAHRPRLPVVDAVRRSFGGPAVMTSICVFHAVIMIMMTVIVVDWLSLVLMMRRSTTYQTATILRFPGPLASPDLLRRPPSLRFPPDLPGHSDQRPPPAPPQLRVPGQVRAAEQVAPGRVQVSHQGADDAGGRPGADAAADDEGGGGRAPGGLGGEGEEDGGRGGDAEQGV